jgi:serralysin
MWSLEPRRLFAAVFPTADEQYLVELINRARANPTAEATRLGIDLNEGLTPGTITTAAKQPLAINPFLVDSARKHSQWMIDNDVFSHTGASGTDPQTRMTNAGYVFSGSWSNGENIAYHSSSVVIQTTPNVLNNHNDLFVDNNYPGRGHRTNLMSNSFREMGPGVATGVFNSMNAVMVTEDFASTGTSVYLTGVSYYDGLAPNNFYSVGEGLPGVTVTAKRVSDNATSSTTTWSSGGYSLALSPGTYTVTATGGSLSDPITYSNVVVGSENVKRDFVMNSQTPASFATVSGGVLTVTGTSAADKFSIIHSGTSYTVTRNGTATTLAGSEVTRISLDGGDGDDQIVLNDTVTVPAYLYGNLGNDKIIGGHANDTLSGGAGKDTIYGGLGDDRLGGNGGHDREYGEAGKDRLYGGDGNDYLDGGSSMDRLWGEAGNDNLYGQGGNDYLYAKDSALDTVYGGTGSDSAQLDLTDTRAAIETLLA